MNSRKICGVDVDFLETCSIQNRIFTQLAIGRAVDESASNGHGGGGAIKGLGAGAPKPVPPPYGRFHTSGFHRFR